MNLHIEWLLQFKKSYLCDKSLCITKQILFLPSILVEGKDSIKFCNIDCTVWVKNIIHYERNNFSQLMPQNKLEFILLYNDCRLQIEACVRRLLLFLTVIY